MYNINVSALKSYRAIFENEKDEFLNKAYSVFSSSYLNKCSDSTILQMKSRLTTLYNLVKWGYGNINNWWQDYVNNTEALENFLADNGRIGTINKSNLRNFVSNYLSELPQYTNSFSDIFFQALSKAGIEFANNESSSIDTLSELLTAFGAIRDKAKEGVQEITSKISAFFEKLREREEQKEAIIESLGFNTVSQDEIAVGHILISLQAIDEAIADTNTEAELQKYVEGKDLIVEAMANYLDISKEDLEDVLEFYEDATEEDQQYIYGYSVTALLTEIRAIENKKKEEATFLGQLKKVGATAGTAIVSLTEGVGILGESLLDTGNIFSTACTSIFTGIWDGGQAVYGLITGNEWESETKKMWNETMSTVKKQYVKDAYDCFYDETAVGQFLKEESYGFETVRAVSSGIGYYGGAIALSIATGGALSPALLTGVAGVGKNTEEAWNEGANVLEGLTYGVAKGSIEGVQMHLGTKFGNKMFFKNGSLIGNQLKNTAAHMGFDGADALLSSFYEPALKLIYSPNETNMEQVMYSVNYDENGNKINDKNWDDLSFWEKYAAMFNYSGGVQGAVTNVLIGSGLSGLSEVFDIGKAMKWSTKHKNIINELNNNIANYKFDVSDSVKLEIANLNKKDLLELVDLYGMNEIASGLTKNQALSIIGEISQDNLKSLLYKYPIDINDLTDVQIMKIYPKLKDVPGFENFTNRLSTTYLVNDYLNYIKDFSKKNISFEDYLKKDGIDVVRFNSKESLSNYLGDSKLYLLDKVSKLKSSSLLSVEQKELIADIYDEYRRVGVADLDFSKMMNDLDSFLTKDEKQMATNLFKNGLIEKQAKKYTYNQLASIYNYTACGGFEINAWLNDTTLRNSSKKARVVFDDIDEIQNKISGHYLNDYKQNRFFKSSDGSILEGLDSVISSTSYDNAIVTYRGVKNLFDYNQKLDVFDLKIGDSFSSHGYQSSSVLLENCYGVGNSAIDQNVDIILEIIVPPKSKTAAYIENVTGVNNYSQTEMLIKRDATMTLVGDVYKKIVNGKEKIFVPVVVQ